ncbi:hypothetical protein [Blastochloris tepida]|uniref:Uncharacterized protein n=1 Tax=Blastochloris tepida TaxID=2233851 RepID=A0A348G1J0_9HYPH|nr:hypothetical protein [Blastochloris tepida]BBF93423.1 hypothetical protein BLTE_21080 [Blastochloris tepida]
MKAALLYSAARLGDAREADIERRAAEVGQRVVESITPEPGVACRVAA